MEFLDYGDPIFFIKEGEDLKWIHDIQNTYDREGITGRLIYVALDGCDDKYLHPDRFLTENYHQSLTNHMMWEGLLDYGEQMDYMVKQIREFQRTGKQLLIEEIDFNDELPIYDYSQHTKQNNG